MLISISYKINDFCKFFKKEIKINLLPKSKIRNKFFNLKISKNINNNSLGYKILKVLLILNTLNIAVKSIFANLFSSLTVYTFKPINLLISWVRLSSHHLIKFNEVLLI